MRCRNCRKICALMAVQPHWTLIGFYPMIFLPFQIYHLNINHLKKPQFQLRCYYPLVSVFSTLNWHIANPISTGVVKLPIFWGIKQYTCNFERFAHNTALFGLVISNDSWNLPIHWPFRRISELQLKGHGLNHLVGHLLQMGVKIHKIIHWSSSSLYTLRSK